MPISQRVSNPPPACGKSIRRGASVTSRVAPSRQTVRFRSRPSASFTTSIIWSKAKIGVPSMAVITSPIRMPASSAADRGVTPSARGGIGKGPCTTISAPSRRTV